MQTRTRISESEIKINPEINDRKKLRKSTDSFKTPEVP